MTKFVVVCQGPQYSDGEYAHDPEWIGWIDDNRLDGGDVQVQAFETARRFPSGHLTYRFVCPLCAGTRWERVDELGNRAGGGQLGVMGIAPDGGFDDFRGARTVSLEESNVAGVLDVLTANPNLIAESVRTRGLNVCVRFPVLPPEVEARPDAERIRAELVKHMQAEYAQLTGGPPLPDMLECGMLDGVRYVITFELLNATMRRIARTASRD